MKRARAMKNRKKKEEKQFYTRTRFIDLHRVSSASVAPRPLIENAVHLSAGRFSEMSQSVGRSVGRLARPWNRFSGIDCTSTQSRIGVVCPVYRSLVQTFSDVLRRDYRKCSCVQDNPNLDDGSCADPPTNSIRILWTVIAAPTRDNGNQSGLSAGAAPDRYVTYTVYTRIIDLSRRLATAFRVGLLKRRQ